MLYNIYLYIMPNQLQKSCTTIGRNIEYRVNNTAHSTGDRSNQDHRAGKYPSKLVSAVKLQD